MSNVGDIDGVALTLHEKIVSGDSLGPSMLAELVVPRIVESLRRKYHAVPDQHLIDTAVADAMLTYLRAPEKFDKDRGSLIGYLWMAAEGDLLNSLKQEKTRGERWREEKVVELQPRPAEYRLEKRADNPEDIYAFVEGQHRVSEQIGSVLADPIDREIAQLMLDGVRETEEFARVLGILDDNDGTRTLIVKRHKDRIKLALRRKLKRSRELGYESEG
jgi:RNA polymerase sigma-70 factor, ECF subfamily